MKKAVLIALAAAIGLGANAFAADDPSIKGQQRIDIKASMAAHIETAKYADAYLIFDAVAGGLKRLNFDHVHDGIVRKGEFFVSCADFYDSAEHLYDIDFLVVEEDGQYRVVQSLVHKIDGDKRKYHVEN